MLHPTKAVFTATPPSKPVAKVNGSLGTNQTLEDMGFTAAQVAASHFGYFSPHVNDAWIDFTGAAAAASDGHRCPAGEITTLSGQNDLQRLVITGTDVFTVTLFTYDTFETDEDLP